MEKFKHKNGSGTMFNNEKTKDNQPDFKGTIVTPDGQEWRVSGWKKSNPKGEFISLAIEEPRYKDSAEGGGSGLPF